MATDRFSKQEFETALANIANNIESDTFGELGLSKGEYVYTLPVNEFSRVVIRSSVGENGYAKETGQDSIRMWLQIKVSAKNGGTTWKSSSKPDAYTQRVPGWEVRMDSKYQTLALKGQKVIKLAGLCNCGKEKYAFFVKSTTKNQGRPFAKCVFKGHDDSFEWLDEGNDNNETKNGGDTTKKSGGLNFLGNEKSNVENKPPDPEVKDFPLNDEQAAFVYAPIGMPIRVMAGPGAGKSYAIEKRLEHMIRDKNVDPDSIVYVTFSKTMADTGRDRIVARLPEIRDTELPSQICTIHALCYRMLKEHHGTGYKQVGKGWKVKQLLEEIIDDIWVNPETAPGWEELENWISVTKLLGLEPSEAKGWYNKRGVPEVFEARTKFDREMTKNNWLTFADMLYEVEVLVRRNPTFLKKFQNKYEHIIIDESQDTNFQAMKILTELGKPQNSFMVIGDVDQMIYRFQGASPEANMFEGFEERYPNGLTFKFTTNYRSTKNIIAEQVRSIAYNYANTGGPYDEKYRKELQPRPDADDGTPTMVSEYADPFDEADDIALRIKQQIDMGAKPGDFYIACRTRSYTGYVEGPLLRAGVPYVNITGRSFWNSKHVKKVISYLTLAVDGNDKEAFENVYNIASQWMVAPWGDDKGRYIPHRFLGKAFLQASRSKMEGVSNAMASRRSFIPGGEDLLSFVDELRTEILAGGPVDGIRFILDNCYLRWLKATEGIDAIGKEGGGGVIDDLETVVDMAKKFDDAGLFVKAIKELQDADKSKKNGNGWEKYVVISTVHRLKGLERDYVYGIGISEGDVQFGEKYYGLLPHTFSQTMPPQQGALPPLGGVGRVEDERCIFYVLVSRAKKEVHLSSVEEYREKPMIPSRFIGEMMGSETRNYLDEKEWLDSEDYNSYEFGDK